MKVAKAILLAYGLIAVAVWGPTQVALAMTSTNYAINFDSINSGGRDDATSTNYALRDTIGEQATGDSTSTNYQIRAGYRTGDAASSALSFSIGTQQNATKVAYSAFSTSTLTVTVASTAGYSTGSLIAVVENEGLSQVIAIGKITAISPTVLTVDAWEGSPNLLSASPSGGDDFVYQAAGENADLGTLASSGKTSLTATQVSSDAANGVTVYVNDDGDLRSSTSTAIVNVSDGSVTAGSEEYGFHMYGTTATSTGQDYPFATSTRAIQLFGTTALDQRVALIYKIAIGPATPGGDYSHIVYYTLTANY